MVKFIVLSNNKNLVSHFLISNLHLFYKEALYSKYMLDKIIGKRFKSLTTVKVSKGLTWATYEKKYIFKEVLSI